MAEEKPRVQRVLEELSQAEDTIRPKEIGDKIGATATNVGKDLHDLKERGLADTEGEGQWRITDEGRKRVESLGQKESRSKEEPKEVTEVTVPSQADLFKAEGALIGVGGKKGSLSLDVIVKWVERTAELDDLGSVWNALTEMGIANDVKRRWIKLYSQSLPGKEIPAELKTKMETGTEEEKVATGKEPPRARRFNVIEGQILADPEGEYTFSMAVQKAMVEKGASSNQAAEMATTFAKMNTDTMNLLIPLLTKDPEGKSSQTAEMMATFAKMNSDTLNMIIPLLNKDPEGSTVTQLLLTQMSDLQKEVRAPQGASEATQQIQALSQQITEMRDTLHSEQLARIQEQNQAQIKELTSYIGRLDARIQASSQGKEVESKIGLLSKALEAGKEELKGIRGDLKPLAQTFVEGRVAPGEKTAVQKRVFSEGIDKGIERAKESAQLEDALFFSGGSTSQ